MFNYSSSFCEQGHSFSTELAYSLTKIQLDILYGIFLCMLYNSIDVSFSLPVQYGLDYIVMWWGLKLDTPILTPYSSFAVDFKLSKDFGFK